jgi:hypothetical protein
MSYVPTKEELLNSFDLAANAIYGDYYDAWVAQGYEPHTFKLLRECVVDFISIHGGDNGIKIEKWIFDNVMTWDQVADEYDLPKSW